MGQTSKGPSSSSSTAVLQAAFSSCSPISSSSQGNHFQWLLQQKSSCQAQYQQSGVVNSVQGVLLCVQGAEARVSNSPRQAAAGKGLPQRRSLLHTLCAERHKLGKTVTGTMLAGLMIIERGSVLLLPLFVCGGA